MCGSVPGRRRDPSGTGAELHLIGAVVSPTGQSLRNRAITTEGAERSSSAQVIRRVPEAGILSLPLCPNTPRSLRGSASPLRSPEKGQQPYPVLSQASAGPEPCPGGHAASRRHVASGAAGESLPRHEFDVKLRDTKTYSHGNFWGLMDCRRRRCMGTPETSRPRTAYPPRYPAAAPAAHWGTGGSCRWPWERAPAQLLLPVVWLCGRRPRSAAGSGRGGLRTPFGSGRNCPGTVPPAAASSRTAGAAVSHFSFRAETPTSGRSPGPGSPTRGGFGRFPRGGGRSALLSPLRSRLRLAFYLPPPHFNRAQLLPRADSAWVPARGWSCFSADAAVGGSRNLSLCFSPLRPYAWPRGSSAAPRSSAQATGQRQRPSGLACGVGTGRHGLGSAVPTRTEGTDSRAAGQTSTCSGLRQPHGHGNRRRCASARRAGGTRSPSDPQPRFPRRAVRPVPPALSSTKRLPRNGVQ
ncbi:unnamed protein product [Coccothraustes coccothraustes]